MGKYDGLLAGLNKDFGDWFVTGKFPSPKMSKDLYPYKDMFNPIKVNSVTIKNRLVMAPMGNISMCEETGRPNEKMIAYFEERAKGGVGLITTGLIPVSYGVDSSIIELGDLVYFPRIDRSRTVFSGWRDLAAACHSHGATVFAQLSAGLGRVGNPQCLVNSLKLPVSASWNSNFYMPDIPCKRLSDRKCNKIIKQFGQASADAKAANLDGVYLHGHEGYLLEQMTNAAFNRRVLGKYSDWQRFGIDTIKMIRKRCGDRYPIMYRIDLSLMLNDTYGEIMNNAKGLKKFKKERAIEETLDYMRNLVKAGVDMFDVDLGCYDNWWLPHPPATMPAGCFLGISELVKKFFEENDIKANTGLPVPVVAVGKLGYPDLAEQALRDNKCDMVMLGRPLLADPDWCNKAMAGNVMDIRPCIGCQEACINEFVEGGHPQCAVNPRCAFEKEYSEQVPKADKQKKIAVIGAGPAGIVASDTLIKRGHSVDLFEKSDKIGGNALIGSIPKFKYELDNYISYLDHILTKLKSNEQFKLHLKQEVTIEHLKNKGYDVVLVAGGSRQCKPPVEGIDNKKVVYAIDILKNPKLVEKAENIVIIGGGVVGCETAYMLNYEYKKNVKVVEMMPYFMNHTCTANRGHILHYLYSGKVELLNCTKLKKVTDTGVVVEKNVHKNVPNPYLRWNPILPENIVNPLAKKIGNEIVTEDIACDLVVLSAGVKSNDELYFDCIRQGVAPEVYNIGDSLKPIKIMEAVRTAYRKARSI